MKPTVQEKYDFLCNLLSVQEVDWYELDGLLALLPSTYFQFPMSRIYGGTISVDEAVEFAMRSE